MPPLSFGFGDFIAVMDMVIKLAKSLEESKGSSADYQGLMKELYAFHRALMEVETLVKSSKLSEPVANSLFVIVTSCREPIERFLRDIDKYRRSLGEKGTSNWARDTLKKFGWVILKTEDIQKLREVLHGLLLSVQILLETSGRSVLYHLNDKMLLYS
jgi:hypothetical protein